MTDTSVTVPARNAGERHGRETVQLYLAATDNSTERPAVGWRASP